MRLRYVFLSGLPAPKDSPFFRRRVTIKANSHYEADAKARVELDRRCEKAGTEPPVSWDLELIEARPL